jgi:hypothetical protein
MPSSSAPLALLAERLEAWLKAVPEAGDRLIQSSLPLLDSTRTATPAWLALRDVGFQWRLHSQLRENEPSWIVGPRISARQMLDAEVSVELKPAPYDEPPPPRAPSGSPTVTVPDPVIARWSLEELGRWAPEGAAPERTLLLRLGPDETLGVWGPAGSDRHEVDQERIRARWVRGDVRRDMAGKGPWPLELLLALVERLLASPAGRPAPGFEFAALESGQPVWGLARAALDTAAAMQGWLDAPRAVSSLGMPLDLLRSRWRVSRHSFRLEALVDAGGRLARPDAEDTFLAPFRLEWDPKPAAPAASIALELPDVVATGELRAALLEKFREASELEDVVDELEEHATARLTVDDVRAWCDPERNGALVLRVDRDDDDDHYLLILTADLGGLPVVALVDAERTRLDIEPGGHWKVAALKGVSLGYVGPLRGAELVPGNGAQGYRKFLGALLRWRLLLP